MRSDNKPIRRRLIALICRTVSVRCKKGRERRAKPRRSRNDGKFECDRGAIKCAGIVVSCLLAIVLRYCATQKSRFGKSKIRVLHLFIIFNNVLLA